MKNGILIIDKPVGFTSHDVVAKLRGILRTKKIGHTGTLDPFATGVLVMLVGKATRLAKYLDKDEKSYEATVRFGFETDTGDRTGEPRKTKDEIRDEEIFEKLKKVGWDKVLEDFRGEIEQIPPMYSAKKVKGKKLYELARKGVEIERKSVKVNISELEILDYGLPKNEYAGTQDIGLFVTCTAGTYIRTLAEDIGRKIGVPCHLAELRRTKAGKFNIEKAVTLEGLEEIVADGKLETILVSMNEAVSHLAKFDLSEKECEQVKNGMRLRFEDGKFSDQENIRLVNAENELVAIGSYKSVEKFIQPRIVMI